MSQMVDDDTASVRLGDRLRRERTDRGWSLTELAGASGVSRAMINRIERGASSPTATILGRLSGAFDLTISQLLAHVEQPTPARSDGEEQAPEVERDATADRWTDPETGYERRPLSSLSFPADVTEVRLPAGASVTYPAAAYAFLRHLIWVVDGELELAVGARVTTLAAGDRIELAEPQEVTYANPTDGPCRYVVVVLHRR